VILVGMAYPATRTVLDMKDASNADISIKVTAYQWKWEYDYQQDGVRFFSSLSTPRDQIDEYQKVGAKKNPITSSKSTARGRPRGQEGAAPHHLQRRDPRLVRAAARHQPVRHPGLREGRLVHIDTPGRYLGQCSQICGKEHGYMPIVVEAKPQAEYAAWVKEQKAKMPAPAPAAAARARPGCGGRRRRRPEQEVDSRRAEGARREGLRRQLRCLPPGHGQGHAAAFRRSTARRS
jgi:cytochrome c oxidase subunit 2